MEKIWHRAGSRAEIEARTVRRVLIRDRWVALLVWEGKIYAIEDECPHRGASLSDGAVKPDGFVECPLHAWEYHVATGEGREDWEGCVAWYPVEERDGVVYVCEEEQFGEE